MSPVVLCGPGECSEARTGEPEDRVTGWTHLPGEVRITIAAAT